MVYLALVRLSFQRQLTYRTANLAGLVTNAFFGLLRASVLVALFGARQHVAGYSVRDAVTYTGITQGLISYIALWGWWDVTRSIRSGEVATDLSRPVDFFWYWAAQDYGRGMGQLALRGLPILALYALLYRVSVPTTLWQTLAVIVSLQLALLVSFALRFLTNLSAFWTADATGFVRLGTMVTTFCSGMMMPLAFFPPWAATAMRFTPFAATINTPVEVYLGVVHGSELAVALGLQCAWALALVALSRAVLAAGVRRLVVQGG
jgi:ABC-2 type transport system permease protein